MRLGLVVPTLSGGGAEKVAATLSCILSHGNEVFVLVFDSRRADFEHCGSLVDLRIRTIRRRELLTRMKDAGLAIVRLRRMKKRLRLDLCISVLDLANIPNILSGVTSNVVSVHENRLSAAAANAERRLANWLIKATYNRAARVVAVSEGVRQSLISGYRVRPEKAIVLNNPVDLAAIDGRAGEPIAAEELTLFASRPTIITMGRLAREKGQWHLLRAFGRVKEHVPGAVLLILGRGELLPYLRNLAEDLGLCRDVHFLGFRRNPHKYVARADLFVLSSLREGFSNALVEALACGTPVISSDCDSGPREILAPDRQDRVSDAVSYERFGVLVPVCDGRLRAAGDALTAGEELLALSILRMLKDAELRNAYAIAGRQRARAFSVQAIGDRWRQLIVDVTGADALSARANHQ